MKALLAKASAPYSEDDLNAIATHCTLMEDNARKVERDMQKRIAAVVLHPRIGQSFPAIVTGVNKYGTFIRTLDPHVDGKLVQGGKGLPDVRRQGDSQVDLDGPAAGVHRVGGVRISTPVACTDQFGGMNATGWNFCVLKALDCV